MNTGQWIALGFAAVFLAWFLWGVIANDRQGRRIQAWLGDGIKGLGTLSQAKWFGSPRAGAYLTVQKPRHPFQKIDLLFSLEARENLPLWIIRPLAGRRDLLIIQASLRPIPAQNITVTPIQKNGTGQEASQPNKAFQIDCDEAGSAPASLDSFLDRYQPSIQYLALKIESPHLVVRAKLGPLLELEGRKFFKDLSELASGK